MSTPIPRLTRRLTTVDRPDWSCFFCQQGVRFFTSFAPQLGSSSACSTWNSVHRRFFFSARFPKQMGLFSAAPPPLPRTFPGSMAVGGRRGRLFSTAAVRRQLQQQQQQQQQKGGKVAVGVDAGRAGARPVGGAAPSMEKMHELYRKRNRTTAYYTLSIILGTVAFSYGSVPMYKMICQTTGWGGQPVRAHGAGGSSSTPTDLSSRLEPVTSAKRIRVTFSSSVSDVLPWKFVPQQREVRVLPGETALAFYTATNLSDRDIIGVATYSVTPAQTAPYFSKIQCFCFEEQRLAAGETVDMPVFFYLDPDLLKDVNMRGVETVTLNYTFFKARYDDNGKK
ncbi:hypothetical protein VTJ04DRAFT_9229 [Mycothermus thermophilus]|uniref:uncharacterized protein n=1 Tax=Humicola insolens TaxID=85995 RepID=UPI003742B140